MRIRQLGIFAYTHYKNYEPAQKESINKYTIQKLLTILKILQIRKTHNINKNRNN